MTKHCYWFILPLLLPTPTIGFLFDQKRNVSDGVASGIGTLFSLDHNLFASDYNSDSDSVARENQALQTAAIKWWKVLCSLA